MTTRLFIYRPILATVIAIIIVLCGLAAMLNMPVAQYPNISPPTISVQAQYPGASAQTVERTVAAQIEAQLNGVNGVLYMSSNSTPGSVSVRLTFEIGTNLNIAINDVLNRVHAAMPLLPSVVQALGVNVKKSSPDALMNIAFYNNGGAFNIFYMSNYLYRTLYNDLNLVPGVGQITYHAKYYAMRVWLNLNAMNVLNITANDIANAIREQNKEYTVGSSNSMPHQHNLLTFNLAGSSMFSTPPQFENIIVRQKGTQIIRLKDVARVELAAYNYNVFPQLSYRDSNQRLQDKQVAVMQIYMDPAANQLEVKQRVLAALAKDAHNFPSGLEYRIVFDATQFISASIVNVMHALRDACILVGLIILLFLQNWRASFIALLTIPVSVIGSFALLYLSGFTINTMTLFAMILAIGIVVDDAIVVIENIERLKEHDDKNLAIHHLVEIAIHEVFGAVIAIALVLSVVFLPVMFLGGLPGVLYRQFATTISFTVLISAFTALTLTPALCALLLKRATLANRFSRQFNLYLAKLTRLYLRLATKLIDYKYTWLTFVLALLSLYLIFKLIPLSFMPNEDQGYIIASVKLPATSSLQDSQQASKNIAQDIMRLDGVQQITQIVGIDFFGSGVNTYVATLIIMLNNWQQRKQPQQSLQYIVDYINHLNGKYNNVLIRAFNQPPVRGLSNTGGVEFYLEGRTTNNLKQLDNKAVELETALMKHKQIKLAYHLLDTNVEQVLTEADAAKAKSYHVDVADVYNAIHYIYSSYNVNFAYIMQGLVWVILQGDYRYRTHLQNLSNIYVRSSTDKLVAINSLVHTKFYKEPLMVERFNDYPATQVIVTPAPGVSSGEIMQIIRQEMSNVARGYDYEWFGTSYMQTRSQKTSLLAFIFAFSMIYLVLCALYEMWRLPLVVLMGMPFALIGSGLMLLARQQPNDLYFQISLITLLGLSAKNIILLIEFALLKLRHGATPKEAILHALELRFRPIVMTSVTFIMGALPLVFASGAGANAEHSVGTGIIGGMLGSVILGTLVTPSYFVLIMRNYNARKDISD